ncbi:MAG: hypothetical protein ACJAZO_002394 [Myxococcota bacterium]
MIPTRRLVLVTLPLLALSAVVFFVKLALAPLLALDALLVVVCVMDWLANRGRVSVERSYKPVQVVGRPFSVLLRLSTPGRRRLSVRVVDDAPGITRGLPYDGRLDALGLEHAYELMVTERGAHSFGVVTVRFRSPLGLFEGQRRLGVDDIVRVYPNFAQLRFNNIHNREDERRAPVRARRKPGGENEFERLRPYVRGDAYRHIDWRATARRQELVTREYGQESNQNVLLLLDCGRMMSAKMGDLSAFDHALNAALMVGQTALRHGDRVGMLAFDDKVRAWLPPKAGARNGARLIRGLYDVFPSAGEPDYAMAFRYLASRVKRRSLVVLFTSIVDDASAELAHQLVSALARRHVPVCVWVRDPEVEALLHKSGVDPYTRGAAAEIAGWREKALADLQRRGALVVGGDPEALTPNLLASYLEVKARRIL